MGCTFSGQARRMWLSEPCLKWVVTIHAFSFSRSNEIMLRLSTLWLREGPAQQDSPKCCLHSSFIHRILRLTVNKFLQFIWLISCIYGLFLFLLFLRLLEKKELPQILARSPRLQRRRKRKTPMSHKSQCQRMPFSSGIHKLPLKDRTRMLHLEMFQK